MNPSPRHAQRCMLAAAGLLLACGSAQSQSVTIYGAIDVYAAQQSGSGVASRKVLGSGLNPNALGFMGREDLGGGLAAGFVLEGQPMMDTGLMGQGGKMFGRQAIVYMEGAFGRVTLGRVHLPGRAFGIKYNASGWLASDPQGQMAVATGSTLGPLMNSDTVGSRVSNAVMYTAPRLGGFTFSVVQSAGEGGPFSAGQVKMTQFGAGFTAGPFTTDLVYSKVPELAGNQLRQTDYSIGAQYRPGGGVTLIVSHFSHQGSSVAAPGATTAIAGSKGTDRTTLIGARFTTGLHTIGATYGQLKAATVHRGRRPGNISAPFSAPLDDVTGWALGYTYALSKRTQLFAAYGSLDSDALGQVSLTADLRPLAGGRSTLAASGVRHSF
jgi:predicted porin